MSCYVAVLPFQAHAKYGTWSIDFAMLEDVFNKSNLFYSLKINLILLNLVDGPLGSYVLDLFS